MRTPTACPRETIGTSSADCAPADPGPTDAIPGSGLRCVSRIGRRVETTWPGTQPASSLRVPSRPSSMSPAHAYATSSSPSRSQIRELRASTSALPRLATSSSTRPRSTSVPIATATSRVISRPRVVRSASRRLASLNSYIIALSIAIAAQPASSTVASSSRSVKSPPAFSVRYRFPQTWPRITNRDAEEATHRRVARREPVALGMAAHVGQAQRLRMIDQHAEDSAPPRQVPDLGAFAIVQPRSEEALQPGVLRVEDAERGVSGAGHLPRRLEHPLEDDPAVELGREGPADCEQAPDPVLLHHPGAGAVEAVRCGGP